MTTPCYQIIFPFLLSLNVSGQVSINKPIGIPIHGQFDSLRLAASKFCIGDTILNSKANFDLTIYRSMAFGDYKLIRISSLNRKSLKIDIYSLNQGKDKLIYHKSFTSSRTDLKTKELITKYDILNLPNLDHDFVVANSLPAVNDGNWYDVEAKVGKTFTFKQFDNPEMYSRFADKAAQARVFTNFIKELEKMLDIKISEPEF